jgi:hypothetical protein
MTALVDTNTDSAYKHKSLYYFSFKLHVSVIYMDHHQASYKNGITVHLDSIPERAKLLVEGGEQVSSGKCV